MESVGEIIQCRSYQNMFAYKIYSVTQSHMSEAYDYIDIMLEVKRIAISVTARVEMNNKK